MKTLGDILREAREAKGVSPSEAAQATRLKVQNIEDLEANDYSKVPAPIYAKGFIKLYAEYLRLEPAPLLERYKAEYQPRRKSLMNPEDDVSYEEKADAARRENRPPREPVWPKVKARLEALAQRLRGIRWPGIRLPWKKIGIGAAIVLALILLISAFRACASRAPSGSPAAAPEAPRVSKTDLLEEPPEPYLENLPEDRPAP